MVGSFLNVVIYRLPRIMETEWRSECRQLLELPPPPTKEQSYNLVWPRSFCPGCRYSIPALHNVPLVSWLVLHGRCAACGMRIHWRYPLIELLTALLFAQAAWYYGLNLAATAAAAYTAMLLCLAVIDLEHRLLPDALTLPLLWLGLLYNLGDGHVELHSAVIGAMAGYLSLWLVLHLARLILRKEGMGHGDLKLLAALGAWLGWQLLPAIIFLASLFGAIIGIGLLVTGRMQPGRPISFGPYLAVAGYLAFYHGDTMLHWYPLPGL